MKLPYPHLPKSEQWNGKWRGVTGEKESQVKGVGLKKQPFGPKGTWYVDLSLVSRSTTHLILAVVVLVGILFCSRKVFL